MESKRILFGIPLALGLAAAGVIAVRSAAPAAEWMTGMVETAEVDVAAKIPGRVDSLFADEGDTLQRGQTLATLESREVDAKVGQAEAAMAAARARWDMARNGARPEEIEAAEGMAEQARRQAELAEKTFRRVESVYRDSVVSEQERDQIEFACRAAAEQKRAAEAKEAMVKSGARGEEIRAAEALYRQAESACREARAYQRETRLTSPVRGIVKDRVADAGEMVAAGYPVFTVINPEDSWVVLQVREDRLSAFREGMEIRSVVPALGNAEVRFRVSRIASMADFATWRATNQKGDFDLKTFEIHLRPAGRIPGLRPGMTVRMRVAR
jgi:HlyD family secretion protein